MDGPASPQIPDSSLICRAIHSDSKMRGRPVRKALVDLFVVGAGGDAGGTGKKKKPEA